MTTRFQFKYNKNDKEKRCQEASLEVLPKMIQSRQTSYKSISRKANDEFKAILVLVLISIYILDFPNLLYNASESFNDDQFSHGVRVFRVPKETLQILLHHIKTKRSIFFPDSDTIVMQKLLLEN